MRLIADIGGTNARFALRAEDGRPTRPLTLRTAEFPSVADAARAYLEREGAQVDEAVIAVNGPVAGDEARPTNTTWAFSISATARAIGVRRIAVINDFVAQAMAMPSLTADEVRRLCPGEPQPEAAIGVIGAGTGLGVAALVRSHGQWQPVPSEGGHVSFAAEDDVEAEVAAILRRRFGRVSNERLLSGPGLVNLAAALAERKGEPLTAATAEEIARRAQDGSDPLCVEAAARFSAILGSAAGNLALTVLAGGGVYVVGGVALGLGQAFDAQRFCARFVDKGRLRPYLESVPVFLVLRADTGLLGAAQLPLEG